MQVAANTVDEKEIAHFSALSADWWDMRGPFAPLHAMNPLRIEYIRDTLHQHFATNHLKGLRILDVGCGGGLICEPLTRLGATMTGIDASEKNIAIASTHAAETGLAIDYRCMPAENLRAESAQFDAVLALEIVEHVADTQAFMDACIGLIRPGGILICSTLNRTARSFGMAIVGAEYVLRWLPRGTHSWQKFMRPSELAALVEQSGGQVRELMGMVYQPFTRTWRLDAKDLRVNYVLVAQKPA